MISLAGWPSGPYAPVHVPFRSLVVASVPALSGSADGAASVCTAGTVPLFEGRCAFWLTVLFDLSTLVFAMLAAPYLIATPTPTSAATISKAPLARIVHFSQPEVWRCTGT